MDLYQQFIYTRTYSRYLEDEKRRETFNETVKYVDSKVAEKARVELSSYMCGVKI